MSSRVAFASTGDYVDQHFGSARYWQVYDIGDDEYRHIEQRVTAAKCKGGCEGGFDHLVEALSDCDAIFVAKIGEGAAAHMISKGKRVFDAAGEIADIIAEIMESDLLSSG
ncbi:MAG: diguanylate cyclase [Oscillospiraceae bacterium]|jgi:predicted Fe-Mo cluster-binding NifX family protein|nr:diguanylate cyclase [Oscillospiraceae bacterium]